MIVSSEEDKKQLRAAGNILSGVLKGLVAATKEGMNAAELDLMAEHAIRAQGAVPSFLNYQPKGAAYPYPASLCVSINDEVVHGLPGADKLFRSGDVVTFDIGLSYKGYFVDTARTFTIGKADDKAAKLLNATKEALDGAIAAAKPGAKTGDIGEVIYRTALKYRLGVVKDLGGHAVGGAVHEDPHIDNEGRAGEGAEIVEGMVLAIEPMLCEGQGDIMVAKDQWTIKMRDRSRAAQFEQTIIVGKDGPEILTEL